MKLPTSMWSAEIVCSAPPSLSRPWTVITLEPIPSTSAPIARQQPRQVLHVGLGGGVGDRRRARRQRRGHQRVLGPHHRGLVHEDRAGAQPLGAGAELDPALAVDPRAEVLEGVDVGVEAAAADEVAARRRHPRLAETGQQRAGQQEGGADLLRELLVHLGVGDRGRAEAQVLSPIQSASTPSRSSSATWASVSRIRGTRWRSSSSSVSRQAARIGRAAFLLPATVSSPESGTPPLMTNFSMGPEFEARVTTGEWGQVWKILIGVLVALARRCSRSTRSSSRAKRRRRAVTVPEGRILEPARRRDRRCVEYGPRTGSPDRPDPLLHLRDRLVGPE